MSQRAKRPNRSEDGSIPVKRRKRTAAEEEEAASLAAAQASQGAWQPRANDLKTIYNRTTTEAPAELFRKDLISAMKLPDSEPLAQDEYWVIVDQWKQEWERGVQVPVNPDSLPEPSVCVLRPRSYKVQKDFKLPKKYIRITKDESFDPETHAFSNAPAQAEAACSYDLDETDVAWLRILNAERASSGLSPVYEDQLERVMERLELCCWEKIQSILRNEEGLGIEYDENVICDVCRSPDSEDGNEMVFCDSCNICVHQACYGITKIPDGQWLCCTCKISKRPDCMLCPNKGGAMKSTRTGQKWAHVSCALWIPEVSIGCVEKMEPITKISSIPSSRWALICVLCRERRGACIQCSVKTCKTAYHVTCAFKHGLEMRAIIEDENADDGVKLRSYCEKHSKSSKKSEKSVCSGSEDDDSKRKKRKDMTNEEKNQARAARLQEIETEFFKHVTPKDVDVRTGVDADALQYIYNYWKLKRKAGNNKPLLPPKSEDVDLLSQKREQADLEKMKMFVQIRQDLERVRNLCYMVSRREKLSRSFFRMREQTFHKQAAVLQSSNTLPNTVIQAVIEANHGPSIYDRLYSHNDAEDHTADFDVLLARIAGLKSPTHSGDEFKSDVNGLFKDVKNNPYKKVYFNGSSKRKSTSLYGSSLSSEGSSDERPKDNKENQLRSSSEDNKSSKKKVETPRKRPGRKKSVRTKGDSSSEEDIIKPQVKSQSRSRLGQIASELGDSGSESDELLPIKKCDNHTKNMSSIYSDSESSDVSMKNDDKATSDSQSKLRTKAAVKEFSNKGGNSKSPNKSSPEPSKKKLRLEEKATNKKNDYVPSDLIVPQRQAAKKASENLKLTNRSKEPHSTPLQSEEAIIKVEEKEKKEVKVKVKKSPKELENKESLDKRKESSKVEQPSKEGDSDLLAFVPQRQAAKKAAEHIKSGLGKSVPPTNETDSINKTEIKTTKKDIIADVQSKSTKKDESESSSKSPAKIPESKRKSSTHSAQSSSTSSSSSGSSSDSGSSSSSDSEEEPENDKVKEKPRSESRDEATKRSSDAKDWPFLDKGARTAASSSSSSESSDSSGASTPPPPARKSSPVASRKPSTSPNKKCPAARKTSPAPARRASVIRNKSPAINRTTQPVSPTKTSKKSTPKREELARRGRGKAARGRPPRPAPYGDRVGDAHVRPGDLSGDKRVGVERRVSKEERDGKLDSPYTANKETRDRPGGILSPVSKAEKKLKENVLEPTEIDLEKEIRERKADKEKESRTKTKSTLEKLFGTPKSKDEAKEEEMRDVEMLDLPIISDKSREKSVEPKEMHKKEIVSNRKSPLRPKNVNEEVKTSKISEEISAADKIVEDHLQSQKLKEQDGVFLNSIDSYNIHQDNNSKHELCENETANATKTLEALQAKSMFSPPSQQKTTDLLDLVNFDDSFGLTKEEMLKGPISFPINNTSLKEDTKEDSARETLNLVEKLRMGLHKKSTSGEGEDGATSNDVESDKGENLEQNSFNFPVNNIITNNHVPKEIANDTRKLPMLQDSTPEALIAQEKPYVPQSEELSHTAPMEGDERWVPPSQNFPNLQSGLENFINTPQFLHRFAPHLALGKEPSVTPSHDPRISQTPMSCMPSPYPDIHPQAKWADSAIMPNRRSSSSSSDSSSESSKREEEVKNHTDMGIPSAQLEIAASFMAAQMPPFPPNHMDHFGAFPDPSLVPVSLFPPRTVNTQIPFPPTGSTGMFPPAFGAPFPASSIPLSKPVEDSIPYSAAFTSTQHNTALTAAMINIPIPTVLEQNLTSTTVETPLLTPSSKASTEEVVPSPLSSAEPQQVNSAMPSPGTSTKVVVGKKSPSKPTRTSARVTSQLLNKSPAKSPGKSPCQELPPKQTNQTRGRGEHKRGSGKSGVSKSQASSRGRGRGKGRGRGSHHNDYDFLGANTIHNKLVGTVYDLDFDDDICSENMTDLKSMRERRKSVDVHEKKFDSYSSPRSPKFASPKNRYATDLRELKPPSPLEEPRTKVTDISANSAPVFPDVTPVLPGPVDMRTYNSANFDQPAYNEHNLLNAFASGTAGAQVHDELDEDFEKELHSALLSTKKAEQPPPPEVASNNNSNIKVSLSDSRNQLKVKIKGPIANYSPNVVALPRPITNTEAASVSTNVVVNNVGGNNTPTGTSNLRRMRKKELLRQYWTQDMNMDDPSSKCSFIAPPTVTPSVNRTIITIPKAVASMTSIPTKEDYRDYRTDDIMETKHHKKSRGLSRELKQLELGEDSNDRRRSGNEPVKHKTRGRPPKAAPKLKIKLGATNSVVAGEEKPEEQNVRPPKKRLATISKPSVEDLKRDSMKFRKQIMADLKIKRRKDKIEKHKKKDRKKPDAEVQIISDETKSTKLIIRFGKPKTEVRTNNCDKSEEARTKDEPQLPKIKLKIARCVEGSGYVTRPSSIPDAVKIAEDRTSQPGQPPPLHLPDALQPPPAPPPLSKDCEVR
ncbi:PHD finger protein rhinoceros [Euwallacea fornicatus]|uniref:PHD finger protein rhinoceros n=1 Tax=Euwallacea fornicatus TaxID=995702 RepID=UPI00338EC159